jgi:dolichol-phosphate mannosyltransferase
MRIAVVIPCYRVKRHILNVICDMPVEVERIYVIDDACPEGTGDHVQALCTDERVRVLRHAENCGVGAAVMTGYGAALADGMEVIAKVDGDGQMDPRLVPDFVRPIVCGEADYTKGNRFFELESLASMPPVRLFGNAALSFMTKLSTGYWDIFDPTNGYTAIHANVVRHLPLAKISQRYFFETDMLFRLNALRAVVIDVPMTARYADEISSLRISRIVGEFLWKHVRNFFKRIFYNYYLRDMSVASIELPTGIVLFLFGLTFGVSVWIGSAHAGMVTSPGTVMLAALPTLVGLQFLLAFLSYDIASVPRKPIFQRLSAWRR